MILTIDDAFYQNTNALCYVDGDLHFRMLEEIFHNRIPIFQIGGNGSIFEGRGWGIFGTHAPRYNSRSIGICLLGNFMGKYIKS